MDQTLFRKLSPLSRPYFFILLMHQISFTARSPSRSFLRAAQPLKNKNGSSLVTETNDRLGCNQPGFRLLPGKSGLYLPKPAPQRNPNFAPTEND